MSIIISTDVQTEYVYMYTTGSWNWSQKMKYGVQEMKDLKIEGDKIQKNNEQKLHWFTFLNCLR